MSAFLPRECCDVQGRCSTFSLAPKHAARRLAGGQVRCDGLGTCMLLLAFTGDPQISLKKGHLQTVLIY